MFDLESNSGKKVSHANRGRRLKKHSAYDSESSTIDTRDSIAEDASVNAGNNLSQMITPAQEESIVPKLKAQKGFKENSFVLCPETCL